MTDTATVADSTALAASVLMTFSAFVEPELAISRGAGRKLSICHFSGGTFEGPRLKGALLPGGGDWAEYESDDFLRIDVRGTLKTDDGALIFMRYLGYWRTPPGVLQAVLKPGGEAHFHARENYLRVSAMFETDAPRYAWLNGLLAVGVGRRADAGVAYTFFAIE